MLKKVEAFLLLSLIVTPCKAHLKNGGSAHSGNRRKYDLTYHPEIAIPLVMPMLTTGLKMFNQALESNAGGGLGGLFGATLAGMANSANLGIPSSMDIPLRSASMAIPFSSTGDSNGLGNVDGATTSGGLGGLLGNNLAQLGASIANFKNIGVFNNMERQIHSNDMTDKEGGLTSIIEGVGLGSQDSGLTSVAFGRKKKKNNGKKANSKKIKEFEKERQQEKTTEWQKKEQGGDRELDQKNEIEVGNKKKTNLKTFTCKETENGTKCMWSIVKKTNDNYDD